MLKMEYCVISMLKMKKLRIALALLIPALFLAAGCVFMSDSSGNSNILSSDQFNASNSSTSLQYIVDPKNYECTEMPGPEPCKAFICTNKSSFWQRFMNIFGLGTDANLTKGKCEFIACNATSYLEILKSDNDKWARAFMTGFGPGMSSADLANLYCNYSLQMPVKWMIGDPPAIPNKQRAECWLQQSALPLFIYYSPNNAIDYRRSGDIASAFSGSGPVMITTQANVDGATPANIDNVRRQIREMNRTCPNCLVVLAVKSGDYNTLEQLLSDPTSPTLMSSEYNITDLIGFGFRTNDYPTCNADEILFENLKFSRDILKKYD
ncbi:MAG: hypothetical protein NT051_02035, partial [Candidatus Micrarchaeota archaeon]|nr:hypothetical protein [Candidatus Micrarchaeota archaeon]